MPAPRAFPPGPIPAGARASRGGSRRRTFLDLTGYGAADLPLAWEAITPPELHARSHAAVAQLTERGVTDAFEKEYSPRRSSPGCARCWTARGQRDGEAACTRP
jgi:hypothetical protein